MIAVILSTAGTGTIDGTLFLARLFSVGGTESATEDVFKDVVADTFVQCSLHLVCHAWKVME